MDTDPMLQSAWEENLRLQAKVERYRDDLSEARKVIADVSAILADGGRSPVRDRVVLAAIQERLDEYAGL